MANVTTTAGETFSHEDHCKMAVLIWRRWGRNMAQAAVAWRRLFQNNCPDFDFERLVDEGIRLETGGQKDIVRSEICQHQNWRTRCAECAIASG